MTPAKRYDWILDYLKDGGGRAAVDVLNRDFVSEYVGATGAKCHIQPYGADSCRQLGRDLSAMKRLGLLRRSRVGLQGMAGMGFPRWVWSYEVRCG